MNNEELLKRADDLLALLTRPDAVREPGGFTLVRDLAAALRAECDARDTFHMDYRMKCDVETKALHVKLEQAERELLRARRERDEARAEVERRHGIGGELVIARAERDEARAEAAALLRKNHQYAFVANASRAEADALRKDAERYRWLNQNVTSHDFYNGNKFLSFEVRRWYHDSHVMTADSLDTAIDAAMKGKSHDAR